jgi:small subunit ribosomal protein S8
MTDPIADALIRIKNGYLAHKDDVILNYSKIIVALCGVLLEQGYIASVKDDESGVHKKLSVALKYNGKSPAMTDVKRISKPGLRVYKGSKELPRVLGGLGIALVSTPKGVMTDKQARKEGVGGEVLAYVW